MMLRISDDEHLVLEFNLWDKVKEASLKKGLKKRYRLPQLFVTVHENHLIIIPNAGGSMRAKKYSHIPSRTLKDSYKIAIKLKGRKFEGIAIDLMGVE